MENRYAYIVSKVEYNINAGFKEQWLFKDEVKAKKFLDTITNEKANEGCEYEMECLEYEDNYLEFNSDRTELEGMCLTVTREDEGFKSEMKATSLSELLHDFDCDYFTHTDTTFKARVPKWLKNEEISELENDIKRFLKGIADDGK